MPQGSFATAGPAQMTRDSWAFVHILGGKPSERAPTAATTGLESTPTKNGQLRMEARNGSGKRRDWGNEREKAQMWLPDSLFYHLGLPGLPRGLWKFEWLKAAPLGQKKGEKRRREEHRLRGSVTLPRWPQAMAGQCRLMHRMEQRKEGRLRCKVCWRWPLLGISRPAER